MDLPEAEDSRSRKRGHPANTSDLTANLRRPEVVGVMSGSDVRERPGGVNRTAGPTFDLSRRRTPPSDLPAAVGHPDHHRDRPGLVAGGDLPPARPGLDFAARRHRRHRRPGRPTASSGAQACSPPCTPGSPATTPPTLLIAHDMCVVAEPVTTFTPSGGCGKGYGNANCRWTGGIATQIRFG